MACLISLTFPLSTTGALEIACSSCCKRLDAEEISTVVSLEVDELDGLSRVERVLDSPGTEVVDLIVLSIFMAFPFFSRILWLALKREATAFLTVICKKTLGFLQIPVSAVSSCEPPEIRCPVGMAQRVHYIRIVLQRCLWRAQYR